MKLISNKRAAENWIPADMPYIVLFAIIFGFSIGILVIFMGSFASRNTAIPKNVEEFILMGRFYNSPNCFAYQDKNSGRVYSKSIDLEKFTNPGIMYRCFPLSNNKYSFKFELDGMGGLGSISASTPNWVERSGPIFEGKDVIVYSDNKIKMAKLSIYVQNV